MTQNKSTPLATYVEYQFDLQPQHPWDDVLIAQLGELGFESFTSDESGVKAYIATEIDREDLLEGLELMQSDLCEISFSKKEIPPTNWNAEWEKNFHPLVVSDDCYIRAPFHEVKGVKYEIIISPKMSFGTGHHPTTFLMSHFLLQEELLSQQVLDMGSGTGLLAILARMRGASEVDAIDIDTWCYENAQENIEINHIDGVKVILGGVEQLTDQSYDTIIANINRNILLQDMPAYVQVLKAGGHILFSGFYTQDLHMIKEKASSLGLSYVHHEVKENWVGAKFVKEM